MNIKAQLRQNQSLLAQETLDRDPGDITTIEDEASVEEARRAWETMKEEMQSA